MRPPTHRQVEVLAVFVRTASTRTAARELGISRQTIKNDLSAIYRKLDARTTVGACLALGWLTIPEEFGRASPDEAVTELAARRLQVRGSSPSERTKAPTWRQLELLAAYVRAGSVEAAAHEQCTTAASVRGHLLRLRQNLDVESSVSALRVLGWLTIPAALRP